MKLSLTSKSVLPLRHPLATRSEPAIHREGVYCSSHLSPTEQNYDVGDRELALEEWRHWLDCTAQSFIVWTDHKNLEYLLPPEMWPTILPFCLQPALWEPLLGRSSPPFERHNEPNWTLGPEL